MFKHIDAYSFIRRLIIISVNLSIVLIICGVLSIYLRSHFYFVGHTIWGAMFYLMSSYSAIIALKCKKVQTNKIYTYFSLANWLFGISVGCILCTEISEDSTFNYYTDPGFCFSSCNYDVTDDPSDDPLPNCDRFELSCHNNMAAVWVEVVALITNTINFMIQSASGFAMSSGCCGLIKSLDIIQPVIEPAKYFDQKTDRKMSQQSKFVKTVGKFSTNRRTIHVSRV